MKKKGLIISTVVMVVVLIASLTTATYAWFSSQASATVDDLTITTKAADGLQIAMTNNEGAVTDIVSGNMNYTEGKWEGDVNDWGSSLGFDGIQIGEITDAVTYYTGTTYPVFNGYGAATTATPGSTYYKAESLSAETGENTTETEYKAYTGTKYAKDGDVYKPVAAYVANKEYFKLISVVAKAGDSGLLQRNVEAAGGTIAEEGILGNGQFLVPTGYDDAINPIGYTAAKKNGNYYYLTMAIKPVTNVAKIGFTMQFTPTQGGTAVANYGNANAIAGAMASSARCNVKVATTGKKEATAQLAPFSAFKFDAGALNKVAQNDFSAYATQDGAYNDNGVYNFFIASSEVNAGTIYYVTMEIWIEGTDNECSQDTAGGGFNLKIDFIYDKEADGTNVNTTTFTSLIPQ